MIYRSIAAMLFVIQTQSICLHGIGRQSVYDKKVKQEINKELKTLMMEVDLSQNAAVATVLDRIVALVQEGADVNTKNSHKTTPLHWAAFQGDAEVVQLFIEKGAKVNAVDRYGTTPLHWAAFQGNAGAVQILINEGADINARKLDGVTPLHWAAFQGNAGAVQILINEGADINAPDATDDTPLHSAVWKGNPKVVQILIHYGANIDVTNYYDDTPHAIVLQLEARFKYEESRLYGIKDENERIAGMQAIAHNPKEATRLEQIQVIKYILEHPDQITSIFPTIPMKNAKNRH